MDDSTLVVLFLFAVVLLAVWIFLPFAVFGTKGKLDQLIAEAKKINSSIEALNSELQALRIVREDDRWESTEPRITGPDRSA